MGITKTDETHIELTVSTRRSGDEDSGARSEEELREESGTLTENETDVSRDAFGSGSIEQELLEGAEPHVETEDYAVKLQTVEVKIETQEPEPHVETEAYADGLQTVEIGIEMQTPEVEEQLSVEEEEDEDES